MINNNKKTLIICPPSMKQTAIENECQGDLKDIKIMSTSEVKENYFFSTNIETLIYICKKEKIAYVFLSLQIKFCRKSL